LRWRERITGKKVGRGRENSARWEKSEKPIDGSNASNPFFVFVKVGKGKSEK